MRTGRRPMVGTLRAALGLQPSDRILAYIRRSFSGPVALATDLERF